MTNQAVWAYSENDAVANEVASAAAEVAKAMSAEAVVIDIGEPRGTVYAKSKLVVRGPKRQVITPEVSAEALFRAAILSKPIAVLIGATRDGRETASRLAAKMKVGCVSEASRLIVEGEKLVAERNAYAGKVIAKVACGLPAVATVKAGAYSKLPETGGEVEEVDVGEVQSKVKLLERRVKVVGTVDLKSAKVIVSAGRGLKSKEDLAMIEALAREMGGALGCSRPLSSDLGWLPEEHHIGLTGITVKPDLYVAVGISGQLQHIAGMKDSKVVAAINTDKDAPIFQASDYGIVGDLYQVVPAMQKALASRRR
ncbi:MAG: electron transfer flavoprotein subunit alpha/FixB family protein [Thaumarchaeota archaeon]|nr:electron transfer flavoprotein subunit alpha/FixB family protein [Nitrososphaerota archaeon]